MTDKYTSNVILTTNVNVSPKDLTGDINNLLTFIIKKKYEGFCTKDGYILKDSIELVNRSIGEIKTINNISHINYNITYSANIISPSVDSVYESTIESKNKLGIISYIKLNDDDTMKDSPYIIITPKEYISDDTYESIQVNNVIKIKVKSFRIKFKSRQIQIVSSLM